jgi:gluconate 2-dehydrogenase gamma chain
MTGWEVGSPVYVTASEPRLVIANDQQGWGVNKGFLARRQTLKHLGILTGTVAGRRFLAGWLPSGLAPKAAGASPEHSMRKMDHSPVNETEPYLPRFFKPDEFKTVETLTELIIPTDDTPGAKEAQVARYIDFVVSAAAEFEPSLQLQWTQGFQLLDSLSREKYQRTFREISTDDQEALLMAMSLPEREPGKTHEGFEFYRLVKGMTVEGFYTSRVGLVDVLGYKGLAFLTEFPGCTHPEHQA